MGGKIAPRASQATEFALTCLFGPRPLVERLSIDQSPVFVTSQVLRLTVPPDLTATRAKPLFSFVNEAVEANLHLRQALGQIR